MQRSSPNWTIAKQYLVVGGSCFASLLAGASVVHRLLAPDLDLSEALEREEAKREAARRAQEKSRDAIC